MDPKDILAFGKMISVVRHEADRTLNPDLPPFKKPLPLKRPKEVKMKIAPPAVLADGVTAEKGDTIYDAHGGVPELSVMGEWAGFGNSFYVTAVNGRHPRRRVLTDLFSAGEAAYRSCHKSIQNTLKSQIAQVRKNEDRLEMVERLMQSHGLTPPARDYCAA